MLGFDSLKYFHHLEGHRKILHIGPMKKNFLLLPILLIAGCATPKMKPTIPAIQLEKVQELLLSKPIDKGRGAFISAASGLSKIGDTYYVISDDEVSLFSFKIGDKNVEATSLMNRKLPADNAERKKLKADFESFVQLDEKQWPPHGAMVGWPSGSTPNRTIAVVLPFKSKTTFGTPKEVNIMPLALLLTQHATELNIEGIMIQEKKVLLFQRGNSTKSKSGIFELKLADFIEGLKTEKWDGKIGFNKIKVGELNGVKLTLADGVWTKHGLLAIATAEDTVSTYADGMVYGTVLLRVSENESEILARFEPILKLEGMTVAEETDKGITLMFVDDADDPKKPSSLWKVSLTNDQLTQIKTK